jgi:hypothetical protein
MGQGGRVREEVGRDKDMEEERGKEMEGRRVGRKGMRWREGDGGKYRIKLLFF